MDLLEVQHALLLLDVVDHVFDKKSGLYMAGADSILPYMAGELRYFRERSRPVIHVQTRLENVHHSYESELLADFVPRTGEIVITKAAMSGFWGTDLTALIKKLNITQLTLIGVATNTSVLLTAADALSLGLEVVVPETCVFCENAAEHASALNLMRHTWKEWQEKVRESRGQK